MGRITGLENIGNTRDLGGMKTADGRKIADGRLIRSGNLSKASENDKNFLAGIIHTVIDFRTDGECAENPDPDIPGVKYIHLPVMESLTAGVTREADADAYALQNLVRTPDIALHYMQGIYEGFAGSDFAAKGYSTFIDILIGNTSGAVLWHCTAGKDRAGMAAMIIEKLLGVSDEDIYADYLLTNRCIEKELVILNEMFSPDNEGDKLAMEYLFTARSEYMDTFFGRIRTLYGGFDGYAEKALGVDAAKRERLREMYLV